MAAHSHQDDLKIDFLHTKRVILPHKIAVSFQKLMILPHKIAILPHVKLMILPGKITFFFPK